MCVPPGAHFFIWVRIMDIYRVAFIGHREILSNIAHKLAHVSISKYPQIAKSILRHVKVNIAFNKIINLAFISHELANYDINQLEFPISEYREEGRIGEKGAYVVKWDKNKNIELLHQFIYNN